MEESRPSRNESDEDLLRLQQEFLASKSAPAAKVIRVGGKRKQNVQQSNLATDRDVVSLGGGAASGLPTPGVTPGSSMPPKKSKFKERVEGKTQWPGAPLPDALDEDPEELMERHDTHITKVLTEIVEKDTSAFPVYYPKAVQGHSSGFPDVFRRENTKDKSKSTSVTKKKSIFALQCEERNKRDLATGQMDTQDDGIIDVNTPTVSSRQVRPMGDEIHNENISKLDSMSEDEILMEQEKLLKMLDPKLVSFLKTRHSEKSQLPKKGAASLANSEEKCVPHAMDTAQKSSSPKEHSVKGLPIDVDSKWVNMNKIEYDKLEWMSDLSVGSDDKKTGSPARFDLHGATVAEDADIPMHEGLHHHGEEPERAGYTLQELFQLARSANMQQRCLALNTLARILVNARKGAFSGCLSRPLTPSLLDSGIPFLARWALDDTTDNTMVSAVHLIHSLLICEQDEDAADKIFFWYRGSEMPRIRAAEEVYEDEDEEGQMKDADVVKQDLIKGFLRMSLLQRLRYIIETWRPDAFVIIQILNILTRICRHSTQAAYEVYNCPRLMDAVVSHFLPSSFGTSDISATKAYGRPVGRCVKLIRVICASGRHIAANLLSRYNLADMLARYLATAQSDFKPSIEKDSDVQLECWRLWCTLARYGKGEVIFRELYSILMSKLQTLCHATPHSPPEMQLELVSLLSTFEAMTNVAAYATTARMSKSQSTEQQQLPEINWSHVFGLEEPLKVCLLKNLNHFTTSHFERKFDPSILASCLNYFATFYAHVGSQPGQDIVHHIEEVDKLVNDLLIPCAQSQSFAGAVQSLRQHSVLLKEDVSERQENSDALPELGSLVNEAGCTNPLLTDGTTIHFVIGLLRFMLALGKFHKEIPKRIFGLVLKNEELLLYVRKVCRTQKTRSYYFGKWEHTMQHILLQMVRMCPQDQAIDFKLYHQLSLKLIISVDQGSEYEVHDLLSTIVFNEVFVDDARNESIPVSSLDVLRIKEYHPLTSATREHFKTSKTELLKDICSSFNDIRTTYLQSLSGMVPGLVKSRNRAMYLCSETDSLLTGNINETLVPIDWPFFPLLELYSKAISVKSDDAAEHIPSSIASEAVVKNTLKLVYFLECHRPNVLSNVSLSIKLTRVMCSFLAGNDFFLNRDIHSYLVGLLQHYTAENALDRMDFIAKIPGLSSFHDFFLAFIEQYQAVSFGDSLFGCYLLLPLQQKHSVLLRRAVWGEHQTVLRSLTVPIKELVIPVGRFLEPEETNVSLLNMYFKALFTNLVHPKRSPLLYLIAVHHVNRFIYDQSKSNMRLKRGMLQQILETQDSDLKCHLINYKQFQGDCECGILLYENLPKIRQDLVDNMRLSH